MADLITMLSAVAGQQGEEADEDFNQTVLLLHGDGTNGAQNNTFLDSSTNNFTITRNGNTTQGTFSPFSVGAGQWSNFFDGSGDYLSIASQSALALGTGDFQISYWVYPTVFSANEPHIMWVTSGDYPALFSNASGNIVLDRYASGTLATTTNAMTLNAWNYIVCSRVGTTLKIWINGSEGASITNSTNFGQSAIRIGNNGISSDLDGYISNMRVVKGAGVTSVTVPTAPLTAISGTSLLTCQSNRFVDNSTNAFAITRNGDVKVTPFSPFAPTAAYSAGTNGGSGYFGGDGNYISAPYNAAFDFSTGDFTVECFAWVIDAGRGNDSNKYGTFLGGGANLSTTNLWSTTLLITSGVVSSLLFEVSGSSVLTASGQSIPLNAWHHFVFCRTGTTLSIFVNGSRVGTTTYSSAINTNSGGTVQIARSPYGGTFQNWFSGYIANARIIKGSGPYDATQTTLTVPTAPLTNITNTSILCNFTNAGIIDNTGKNNLETVGNAQIDTAVKKYGTGSLEFDGSGDWLLMPNNPDQQLGTGNFTIEFWVYLASGDTGSARGLVAKGGASTGWLVSLDSSQKVVFTYTTSTITSSGAITTNAWNHIAVVRSGTGSNQTKIYIGGTNDGTGTVSTDFNQTESMYVGANRTGGDPMKGFIDDLRITKGIARYTANFSVPGSAFPDQ